MPDKKCSKCGETKDVSLFNKNKNKKDGFNRICRECTKKEHTDWYNKNKQVQIIKNKTVNQKKKNRFVEYKKTCSCSKCGDKRWYILDFHHKDPSQKNFGISSNYSRSNTDFWNEIKKCIPLCRNCHSEFHYLEKINGTKIEDYVDL